MEKLPDAGTVRLSGPNVTLTPLTWPETGSGTRPPPRSAEITASVVWLLEFTRFVTATGRKTERLPVNTAPGLEPEHCRRISPTRSARPSERTWVGTAVTAHVPDTGGV